MSDGGPAAARMCHTCKALCAHLVRPRLRAQPLRRRAVSRRVGHTRLAARARRAEVAGFESLWVGDHIALPDDATDPRPNLASKR
jgi:alkanesulfonate monooxygenase SsuD/methylene tetrahydromethanopterin reductase-like flavin-dependent oxidoreductase (luciferase family)